MRKLYSLLGLTLLLTLSACVTNEPSKKDAAPKTSALTEQLAEGKELNTDNCTKCHDTSVYTKTDRKVQTLEVLTKRVQACNSKTGAGLEEEELKALTLFLNTEYYKFKK
jgi:cytochrome c5